VHAVDGVRLESDRRFLGWRQQQQGIGGARELFDERATVGAGGYVDERASALLSGRDP
jgi:hypothetical protein